MKNRKGKIVWGYALSMIMLIPRLDYEFGGDAPSIKCAKQHGMLYTLKYIYYKLKSRNLNLTYI